MSITSGYTKYKRYQKLSDGTYQLISQWTSSNTVEFDDGKTAEEKIATIQSTLDGKAASSHNHAASNITSGTLSSDRLPTVPITKGGTGATTAAGVLTNLGITATATELNYMDGVTSNVQTQLDAKAIIKTLTSEDLNSVVKEGFYNAGGGNSVTNKPSGIDHFGMIVTHNASGTYHTQILMGSDGKQWRRTCTNGTWGNWSADKLTDTTYSAAGSSLGLVKSGGDVTISSGVITVNDDSHNHTIANVDNLQSSLDSKQATITGGASTITSSNLTTGRALISDSNGKVAVSAVTSTELGYLDGVTSAIQTQLDGKSSTSHTHNYAGSSSAGGSANSAVKWSTARTINGMSVDGSANRINYGTCSTNAATAAKTVACTGFALVTGAEITVKFTVTNTASSPTLNVNSTGAKSIYYRGSAISAGYLAANRTYTFRYDGTNWDLVGDINVDTNTDTKVTNTLATTTKAYVTGTTSASTNTGTQVFDTGVYLDTTAGQLTATTFKGALDGNAKTATTATSATSSTKATQDASGNVITSTYETKSDANTKLATAKSYTDSKISDLINSAPTTLDTLGEIATAMEENESVVDALNDAIGTKANSSDLTSHTSNTSNPHNVTKSQIGLGSVENKSSATIRGEITSSNVTTALGYTPYTPAEVDEKLGNKVDAVSGKGLSTNDYTTTEKTKLSGIATGAEVNQNAFSNIKVGDTTVAADAKTDTLTLAGSNVTLTPDATNDKVTIGITKANVVSALGYTPPTTDTVYTHPTTAGNKHIPAGGSSGQILRWSADGTAVWDNDNNTDTKVTNTLATKTKAYVTGTTSSSTNTGTQVFDTGVYLDTTAGQLTATTFKGDLSGNATTATTATKLGSTTVGSETKPIYLKSGAATSCSSYAGGTAVTLNGTSKAASTASFYAPTDAGTSGILLQSSGSGKPTWSNTMSSALIFKNGIAINGYGASGTSYEMLRMGGTSSEPKIIIGDGLYTSGVGVTNVTAGEEVKLLTSNDSVRLINQKSTTNTYKAAFIPGHAGTITLGNSSNKWHSIYSSNGTIQTSDAREKENIIPLGTFVEASIDGETRQVDIHSELFDRLNPVQYNFINNNERIHYGLLAQDVVSSMAELGIGENDLDLVHHDYNIDEETGKEKDTYGLSYNNLIPMLIHEVQKLKNRVSELENQLGSF